VRARHHPAEVDRDEGAPLSPTSHSRALGNRGSIALLRALSPAAVVGDPGGSSEREAAVAAAGRPDPAIVHDNPAAHAASRRWGALAFTTAGEIFLSSAMAGLGRTDRDRILAHEQVHATRHPTTVDGSPIVHRAPEDQPPTPEQERVALHLQNVLDTLPELTDDQQNRLQTALGGVPLLDLIRQRRELADQHRRETESTQSRGMGILMYTGPAAERARRIVDLDQRVAQGLAALGLANERALFRLVEEEVPGPVAQGLRANPGPATLARLHDEALAAGAGADAADQLTRRAAQQFGLNPDDVLQLAPQTRRAAVANPQLLADYERLANERMAAITRDVLGAQRATPARLRLQVLFQDFESLRRSVGDRALTEVERQQAMQILREARDLARTDFGTLRTSIWRRMRADPDLERLARDMAAGSDAQLGRRAGSVRIRTLWDEGDEAYQALEVEHKVRLSDNPWRYNDPDNLILTDSAQNQQYLEALRREGGIWATEDVERFVISHGLLDQTSVGAPRGR
jgi:hypothetical protein